MQITSIREPSRADLRRHFAAGARCIVLMADGKFIATQEDCDAIRAMVGFKSPM
jgi:hypothetical protein